MFNLHALKASVNLPALAQSLGVKPDRTSKRYWCPFADHGRANLVLKDRSFRCFACGVGGGMIDFVMHLEGCDFAGAVKIIADYAGFPMPRRRGARPAPSKRFTFQPGLATTPQDEAKTEPPVELRIKVLTALFRATRLPSDAPDDHPALRYLHGRGISRNTAVAAGVCYLADYEQATEELRKKVPQDLLRACGLFNQRGNLVLWRHRLLFPLLLDGECYGFQARNTEWKKKEDGPKELSVGGNLALPFNADVVLTTPAEVYVCEGVIDALTLLEHGLPAVGVPGATRFRPEWVNMFVDIPNVIVAFDADEAGHKGTNLVLDAFAATGRTDVKTLVFPVGVKDVNEWVTRLNSETDGVRQ